MPKASEVGETLSTGRDGAVPVPDAVTVGFPASLETVIVAVFAPVLPGEKTTLNVWVPPAATVKGAVGDVTEKSAVLLFVIPVTLSVADPVFDIVTVCAAELVPVA